MGTTAIAWAVLTPTANPPPRSLSGDYGGIGAEATAGYGIGADALIGGSRRGIIRQPLSVQTQKGLNIAAGVAALALRAEQPPVRVGKGWAFFFCSRPRGLARWAEGMLWADRAMGTKTPTGSDGSKSVVKPAFVAVPPAAATALAMPAPSCAPWAHRAAGDATMAAHIVPAAIVAYAHESGDFIDEGLGSGRGRAAAEWRGAGRSRPQRGGDKHGGAEET